MPNNETLPVWLAPHFNAYMQEIKRYVPDSCYQNLTLSITMELSNSLKDCEWHKIKTSAENLAKHIKIMIHISHRADTVRLNRDIHQKLLASIATTLDLDLLCILYKTNPIFPNEIPIAKGLMQEYSLKISSEHSDPIESYCAVITKTKDLPFEIKKIFVKDFVDSIREKTLLEIARHRALNLADSQIQDTIVWLARYTQNHVEAVGLYAILSNRPNAAYVEHFVPKEMQIRKALYGNIDEVAAVLNNFRDLLPYLVTAGRLSDYFDQIITLTLQFSLTKKMQDDLYLIALYLLDNINLGQLFANPKQAAQILEHLANTYNYKPAAKTLSEVYWEGATPGTCVTKDKSVNPDLLLALEYGDKAGIRNSSCLYLYAYAQRMCAKYMFTNPLAETPNRQPLDNRYRF